MCSSAPATFRCRRTSTGPTRLPIASVIKPSSRASVGSVAAPTAGLHFTPEILDACRASGSRIARVTLHVGLGTFQPLHTDVIEEVKLHSESFRCRPKPSAPWTPRHESSR